MNATIEQGTGEHAVPQSLWPINPDEWVDDDLEYGRHTSNDSPVTVEDILDRDPGWRLEYRGDLRMTSYPDERTGPSAESIVARLLNERKAELLAEHEARYPTVDKAPITEFIQVAPPFWDTATPEGILLKPRYPVGPPNREMQDPDATVGFMPVRDVPPPQGFPIGPIVEEMAGKAHTKMWSEPPNLAESMHVSYTKVDPYDDPEWAHGRKLFAPIDTRVKKVPLWKQAIAGFKKPGWKGLP